VIGDSIAMAGGDVNGDGIAGNDRHMGFPTHVNHMLTAALGRPISVRTLGSGGGTIRSAMGLGGSVDLIGKACQDRRVACVVVEFGNNDCKIDYGQTEARVVLDEFRTLLGRAISQSLSCRKRVVVLSPVRGRRHAIPYYDLANVARYVEAARAVVESFARDEDVVFVDVFTNMTPEMLQPMCYLHPNLEGHVYIASQIVEFAGPSVARIPSWEADGDQSVQIQGPLREVMW